MTPSHVAALLGYDERDAITAVPFDQLPAPVPKGNREQRRATERTRIREARSRND